ncbi:MAG: hypothetical protein RLZZ83_276 [Pseudomonadota bacterium]
MSKLFASLVAGLFALSLNAFAADAAKPAANAKPAADAKAAPAAKPAADAKAAK